MSSAGDAVLGEVDTVLFDVDGTLIDSNYQHALAWYRAFRHYDHVVPLWRIHRAIGQGGDQFVPYLLGDEVDEDQGDALRDAWAKEFEPMLAEIAPFEGARELLVEVKRRGYKVVLASSGSTSTVEHFLDLLDARELADAWTTSDDVERSKPYPDLVAVAMERVEGVRGVLVGDSVWDVEAAARITVPTLAVRTGGYSTEELLAAGAAAVFDSPVELLGAWETVVPASS